MPLAEGFRISFVTVLTYTGDMIIIMTDGVYDNLDPIHEGLMPTNLGSQSQFTFFSYLLQATITLPGHASMPNRTC